MDTITDEELIAHGLPPRGGCLFWKKGGDEILRSAMESMRAESSQRVLAEFIKERFPYGCKYFTVKQLRDAVAEAGLTFVPSHGSNRGVRRALLPELTKVLANFSGSRGDAAAVHPPWLHRVDYGREVPGWQGHAGKEVGE